MGNQPVESGTLDQLLTKILAQALKEGTLKPEQLVTQFGGIVAFIANFGGIHEFLDKGAKQPWFMSWLVNSVPIDDIVGTLKTEDLVSLVFNDQLADSSANRELIQTFLENMLRQQVLDDDSGNTELKFLLIFGRETFEGLLEEQPTWATRALKIMEQADRAAATKFFKNFSFKPMCQRLPFKTLLRPIKYLSRFKKGDSGLNWASKPPPPMTVRRLGASASLPIPVEPDPFETAQPVRHSIEPPAAEDATDEDGPEIELED